MLGGHRPDDQLVAVAADGLQPGNAMEVDEVLGGRKRVAVDFPDDRRYDYLALDRPSATKAQVTIIEGCNKNCTFCIVPTTRGREVSRPFDDVLSEVRASGRVEIELLGQTVNAYRCPVSGRDFGALLAAVAQIDGVARLRFMTSHPAEVNDSMIAAMRDHANISRYLHLPVQSGSSRVLRRMKRLYTREKYVETIARIRRIRRTENYAAIDQHMPRIAVLLWQCDQETVAQSLPVHAN